MEEKSLCVWWTLTDEIEVFLITDFQRMLALAIYRRKTTFLSKLQHTDNTLLAIVCRNTAPEIAKLPL